MSELREDSVLGIGNPLLDIIVNGDEALLDKYGLKPDNAIIGDETHLPLYKEIQEKYDPVYTAGGAAQNSIRVCQWILKKPNVCVFMGSVGKDEYSQILEKKAKEGGVHVRYQYQDNISTGTCACVVTQGKSSHRSLVANLAAANAFTKDHIEKPENVRIIQNVDHIYIGGFFLTVSPESIMELAETAHSDKRKTLLTNLSAPFIAECFTEPLIKLLPYVDVLFGNNTEAEALAKVLNFDTHDVKEISLKIAQLPRKDPSRKMIVVITQGPDSVLLVEDDKITEIPAIKIPSENIVDTNGAGDAFVGGFLSQFVLGKPLVDCVKCAVWAATHIIQQNGCAFDMQLQYVPSS